MTSTAVLLATFADRQALGRALPRLRETQAQRLRAFSPVALEEDEQEGGPERPSPIRWLALAAGLVGCGSGFWLCIGAALRYSQILGGKPPISWLPYCIPGFELTILVSALTTVGAVLVYSRLWPRLGLPAGTHQPFSADAFGVEVECRRAERETLRQLLRSLGAGEIREL